MTGIPALIVSANAQGRLVRRHPLPLGERAGVRGKIKDTLSPLGERVGVRGKIEKTASPSLGERVGVRGKKEAVV
jgi:hypothetical protein